MYIDRHTHTHTHSVIPHRPHTIIHPHTHTNTQSYNHTLTHLHKHTIIQPYTHTLRYTKNTNINKIMESFITMKPHISACNMIHPRVESDLLNEMYLYVYIGEAVCV